jgi:MFS family permease
VPERTGLRALAARWALLGRFGDLPPVMRLLVATQCAFNVGFYMVLPYLATHLVDDLALAGWLVGLVLGLRTFSQQGLFAVGGALADRLGTRPMVLTGCGLRVAGFVVLGLSSSLPGVVAGALLTGVAAALFSPAVESALAREAGADGPVARSTVFALFSVSGQVGTVVGPLLGALLLVVDFRVTCLVAAAGFVLIGAGHWWLLPRRPPAHADEAVVAGWLEVLRNRRFMAFALGYSGYLLCYNQLYLALPIELGRVDADHVLAWLFAAASVVLIVGQLPVTTWATTRLGHTRGIVVGFGLMACAFLAVAGAAPTGTTSLLPAVAMVLLLTLGQMLAVPLAQDLVPRLADERRLGSYFGVLSSCGGVAVLVGSTVTGSLFSLADDTDRDVWTVALPWLVLALVPLVSAGVVAAVARRPAPQEV